jgi:hypothetical protein
MFSFPTDDRRNRVLLRINDSGWSKVSSRPVPARCPSTNVSLFAAIEFRDRWDGD